MTHAQHDRIQIYVTLVGEVHCTIVLPYSYVVYISTVSLVGTQQAAMPLLALGIGAMKVRVANSMPSNILLTINIDITGCTDRGRNHDAFHRR